MSLVTRCTACATVFRVVQDQLKVSEGWVRCGRCNQVFNALEGLFDLDRDAQPEGPGPAGPVVMPEPADSAVGDAAPSLAPAAPATSLVDKIDAQLLGSRSGEHPAAISARDRLEFPDAQFDPGMGEEDTIAAGLLVSDHSDVGGAVPPDAAPGFLQRAHRQARRQSPHMRALQFAALALLGVILVLQVVHHQRDAIAARWPATAVLLTGWCAMMSCVIAAPRRIDDVAVESTALTRVSPGSEAFRLSVALRNRGRTAIEQPSVDLSLTDANGQLIARRMLAPGEFRTSTPSIAPGAEAALQLLLSAGTARISGYTVEVFYP